MEISLKVIIYLMTACVSLSVTGNKGGLNNINCNKAGDNPPATYTEHHGGSVTIDCNYPSAEKSRIKNFCKHENFRCTNLISSHTAPYTKKDRFSLTDKQKGVYTVTISALTEKDDGRYQCTMDGLTDNSSACLTEIQLHILKKSEPLAKEGRTPPMDKDMIAGVVGGLALLLILVVLIVLILVRHKLPQVCCAAGRSSEQMTNDGHNTEGNHGDHHYEEIQMRNQQASSGDTLPTVYATVNTPADQLHYASVNFQKDSVSVSTDGNALPGTNRNGFSACDYSISRTQGDTHPAAAEQTLYSTVTKPGVP